MELQFSSLTETVEEFSTNYVPGSSPRGKTGDPRKCPPARRAAILNRILFSNHLVLVAQASFLA